MENEKNGKETLEKPEQSLIEVEKGLITKEAIQQAEQQVDWINKIKTISLRATNPLDWVIMGDRVCLQNSGCMKIAGLWGVSFESPVISEEKRSDDKGDYVVFTCAGKATFRRRIVEDMGTASTRDPLFGEKRGITKPLSEVDITDVKKAAITNWQSRLLKKILGLAFELSDLEDAKINIVKIKRVEYASGYGGGGKISEAQRNRLFALLKNGKKTPEQLKVYLANIHNIEHTADIPKEKYDEICKWAETPFQSPNSTQV